MMLSAYPPPIIVTLKVSGCSIGAMSSARRQPPDPALISAIGTRPVNAVMLSQDLRHPTCWARQIFRNKQKAVLNGVVTLQILIRHLPSDVRLLTLFICPCPWAAPAALLRRGPRHQLLGYQQRLPSFPLTCSSRPSLAAAAVKLLKWVR